MRASVKKGAVSRARAFCRKNVVNSTLQNFQEGKEGAVAETAFAELPAQPTVTPTRVTRVDGFSESELGCVCVVFATQHKVRVPIGGGK